VLRRLPLAALLVLAGCASAPFQTDGAKRPAGAGAANTAGSGAGPVLSAPTEIVNPPPETTIEPPPSATAPIQKERRAAPPATLSPASRALVSQAKGQRQKGDLPGATVSLDRALRIEPNNPLLWIEMGRLRMDQRNFPQAENMGRKALAMSVGDDQTQAAAWQLIGESLRARGKNPAAQDAFDRAAELRTN
jgi:tetratricopeptide (TPR) repeat protein